MNPDSQARNSNPEIQGVAPVPAPPLGAANPGTGTGERTGDPRLFPRAAADSSAQEIELGRRGIEALGRARSKLWAEQLRLLAQ